MTGDEDPPSFDPRSWTAARAPEPAAAPAKSPRDDAPTSFDPRSWGDAKAAPPPPPPMPADRAGDAAGGPPTRQRLLAGLSCAAILLAGAGLSWAMREPATAPVPPPATVAGTGTAPAPAAPLDNVSHRTLVIASVDDLGPTLASSGVAPDQVRAALGATVPGLGKAPGDIRVAIELVGDGTAPRLTQLEATREDGAGVTLGIRPDGSYAATVVQARLSTRVKVVRGEMDATSFYNAAVTAGITDTLVSDFAAAFSFDFDFQREIHPGDIFEAAFEQKVNPEGEEVGPPTLIYVSMSTPEKSKALYRFLAPGDTAPGWYDGNGRSTVRALMRTPVDGARISSQFGMRMHPVLGFMKMHKGTDFAAPIGTPIYAAGNATVEWAAMKGPNGNLTILLHDNGWETYYLHQSMFMPGVTQGAHVRQGQQIGAIGTTGRSTGPHLHYEVHINKEPVDPLSLDYGTGKSLAGAGMAAFRKERDRIDSARAHSLG